MGKGDKKSKKGKIWLGSYGVSRSRRGIKARLKRSASSKPVVAVAAVDEKPKAKRTSRKKEVASE